MAAKNYLDKVEAPKGWPDCCTQSFYMAHYMGWESAEQATARAIKEALKQNGWINDREIHEQFRISKDDFEAVFKEYGV